MIIFLYLFSLALQWLIRRFGEAMILQFIDYIRLKYFKKLEQMPAQDIIKQHSGYILSLINKVADMSGRGILGVFWCFAHSIATLSLFFFFTARESFGVAFLNLAVLLVFLIVSVFLSKKIILIADELNLKRASLLESYVDFMVNILTIKKLSIYSFAKKRLNDKTEDNYSQIQKMQNFHANRWFFLHALYGVAFLSTIIFLVFQISQGIIGLSILILFVPVYGFMRVNVERLSEYFKSLMELKAYIISLEKAVSSSENFNNGNIKNKKWQEIEFKDIFFKYPENDKIIKIPDFKIKKGEKICVMGEFGEGKTTLLNLIADFLKQQKGERLVDNNSYKKIDKDFFKTKIVMVSQEIELFNLSLRENISLGQNISEEKIIGIFKELNLSCWLKTLPNELETKIGEKGIKLSAGQKQRINLIRGILLNREIFLLDESTSHLDFKTKEKVILFLEKYLKRKTAVIVSHHQNLRRICDRCYIIKNGILKELL